MALPPFYFFLRVHGLCIFPGDSLADGFHLLGRILSFQYNGSLVNLAAAMEPSEIYIVTKALSMMAPPDKPGPDRYDAAYHYNIRSGPHPQHGAADYGTEKNNRQVYGCPGIFICLVGYFLIRGKLLCLFQFLNPPLLRQA